MSWIESIFGGTNVIDDGMKLADNAFFTDQEKSEAKRALLKSYEPFKLVQRGLAFVTAGLFAFVLTIQIILIVLGIWLPSTIEVAMQINSLEIVGMLGWSFMAVMSLYFTGGLMSSFRGK